MKFRGFAEIQATVTFVVEPRNGGKYYDAELSPLDAIAQFPLTRIDRRR
jgi:hypothetical protein